MYVHLTKSADLRPKHLEANFTWNNVIFDVIFLFLSSVNNYLFIML